MSRVKAKMLDLNLNLRYILYADDVLLIAKNESEAKNAIDIMTKELKKYGLTMESHQQPVHAIAKQTLNPHMLETESYTKPNEQHKPNSIIMLNCTKKC